MTTLSYIALFGSVLLSGLSIFLFRKINANYLKLTLSFSGSFLFALSLLHLIPEVYNSPVKNIGLFILFGFFLQNVFRHRVDRGQHILTGDFIGDFDTVIFFKQHDQFQLLQSLNARHLQTVAPPSFRARIVTP